MKLKAFTLAYDSERCAFDDTELQAFLTDKRVLDVSERFFVHDGAPVWALLVSYRSDGGPSAVRRSTRDGGERVDWRNQVPEPDRPMYDTLRQWRNQRAQADGKPAYVLLTNRQLATIASARPTTLAQLSAVDGVGEARLKAFGEALLTVIAQGPSDAG